MATKSPSAKSVKTSAIPLKEPKLTDSTPPKHSSNGVSSKASKTTAKERKTALNPTFDRFVMSQLVYGLSSENFAAFNKSKDVTLVLFYFPKDSNSYWCRSRFVQAAECTYRDNHAYAAVDCTKDKTLCDFVGAVNEPMYVLYSRGRFVNSVKDFWTLDCSTMRRFIETAPESSTISACDPLPTN